MKRGKAGSGADTIALARALESSRRERNRLFDDPLSEGFLGPVARHLFRLARLPVLGPLLLALADRLAPGVRAFIIGRTRFIDDALAAALRAGLDQLVVLGAGYDSRAYRMPGIEAARVFELDLPSAQAEKRLRLGRCLAKPPEHVTFVPIDFESGSLAEALPGAGFREGRRTFFICEGVTEHVSSGATDRIFRYVASAAEPGSRIAFTYLDRRLLDGEGSFPGTRWHVAFSGFSICRLALHPEELREYLSERGLELVEVVAGAELRERYFAPVRRRIRTNEFHRTALARIPASALDGERS